MDIVNRKVNTDKILNYLDGKCGELIYPIDSKNYTEFVNEIGRRIPREKRKINSERQIAPEEKEEILSFPVFFDRRVIERILQNEMNSDFWEIFNRS